MEKFPDIVKKENQGKETDEKMGDKKETARPASESSGKAERSSREKTTVSRSKPWEWELPAVEMKNKISWVNPGLNLPFDFQEGQTAPVGVFLNPRPQEGQKVFNLGIVRGHSRSGLIGQVIFADKKNPNLLYRDVDLKGIGASRRKRWPAITREGRLEEETGEVEPVGERGLGTGTDASAWGFLDKKLAEHDRDMSEKLVKEGLRTHRIVMITRLKEIVDREGKKISIAEAKTQGLLRPKDNPVVEMRAFGVRARTQEADNPKLLQDAKNMVAKELGKNNDNFSYEEYLQWFAKTLGEQVAILHNNNLGHQYLTSHNITLDCRIVDLDSIFPLEPKSGSIDERLSEIKEDYESAMNSIGILASDTWRGLLELLELFKTKRDEREYDLNRLYLPGLRDLSIYTLEKIFDNAYFGSLKDDWRGW